MRNLFEEPVMKWCMICKCNDFKDFRRFKFAYQEETKTKILLEKFKLQLPFRLTKAFEDKMNS